MERNRSSGASGTLLVGLGAVLVALTGIGGWFASRTFADPAAALSFGDRRAIEVVVREYILENPEIIPEAMEELQRKEGAQALSGVRDQVETPFPGAVLGNPNGTVTLVEFSDFACGYCRRSVEDVNALLAKRPELRIVVRELPILSEQSAAAARMALAAAEQGKYHAFYNAMFAAGQPGPAAIEAAARKAGLDLAKARDAAASDRIAAELDKNLDVARQLGFNGTPSWIVGDELISGAVGVDTLAKAIDKAQS